MTTVLRAARTESVGVRVFSASFTFGWCLGFGAVRLGIDGGSRP